MAEGVPVLEDLIGLDWPRSDDTEVIESNTPYLYGYAGWFEPVNGVIEIGDELDQNVILHELTHRWFNDQMFATRWINEGLAEELAAQAMAELGGDPEASKLPPAAHPGHQPLNTWSDPQLQSAATEQQEAYGYAASYAVVHEVVDELGEDATRRVLRAAAADRIAYVGDAEPERQVASASWRYFLDLVEELGGASEASERFEAVVVDEAGKDDLADRAEARERYADLEQAGKGWAAPLVVRRAMASWRFDEADPADRAVRGGARPPGAAGSPSPCARPRGATDPRGCLRGVRPRPRRGPSRRSGARRRGERTGPGGRRGGPQLGPLARSAGGSRRPTTTWPRPAPPSSRDARQRPGRPPTEAADQANGADLPWRDGPRRARARHLGRRGHDAPPARPAQPPGGAGGGPCDWGGPAST